MHAPHQTNVLEAQSRLSDLSRLFTKGRRLTQIISPITRLGSKLVLYWAGANVVVVQGTVYRTCSGLPVLVVPASFEIPRVVREVKIKLSAKRHRERHLSAGVLSAINEL